MVDAEDHGTDGQAACSDGCVLIIFSGGALADPDFGSRGNELLVEDFIIDGTTTTTTGAPVIKHDPELTIPKLASSHHSVRASAQSSL